MTTTAATTKETMQEYFAALGGKPKNAALIDQYVTDPALKQHILETEAAFPHYDLEVHHLVVEGSTVAANTTFKGVQQGAFAGIAPTGKAVSAAATIFYEVEDGKIRKFWLLVDVPAMISQLQG